MTVKHRFTEVDVEMMYKLRQLPLPQCWVVQGLTSHRTHYRSFQRQVFCKGFPSLLQVKRPNQQQMPQGQQHTTCTILQ